MPGGEVSLVRRGNSRFGFLFSLEFGFFLNRFRCSSELIGFGFAGPPNGLLTFSLSKEYSVPESFKSENPLGLLTTGPIIGEIPSLSVRLPSDSSKLFIRPETIGLDLLPEPTIK